MQKIANIQMLPSTNTKKEVSKVGLVTHKELKNILFDMQANLSFFMQKKNDDDIELVAREWSQLYLKPFTYEDCKKTYNLIILLSIKNCQVSEFMQLASIVKKYKQVDINEARKIVFNSEVKDAVKELAITIKSVAHRNAIAREQKQRQSEYLKIGQLPTSKEDAKKNIKDLMKQMKS